MYYLYNKRVIISYFHPLKIIIKLSMIFLTIFQGFFIVFLFYENNFLY